jgi:hypothetical protein
MKRTVVALALLVGCGGGKSGAPPTTVGPGSTPDGAAMAMTGADGGAPPAPWSPAPPSVYASKVKNLLTGLPLADEELRGVTANPASFPSLVDTWMATPQWRSKMLEFFKQAFQQTQTDINDYDEQLGRTTNPWNNSDRVKFRVAAEESFARTVLALIDEGRPFTEVLTTDRFMLNAPLMSSYAFIDAFPQSDSDKVVAQGIWLIRQKYPMFSFTRTTNLDPTTGMPVPIALEDSINPASPHFMVWYDPNPYAGALERCKEPEVRMGANGLSALADFLYGGRPGCGSTTSQWTAADWDGWRMVKVRVPRAGEERSVFFDVPRLRDPATAELVLNTPRIGFMSTLAFFANWPTNNSNSYRVTTNQTMIVALGTSFDDSGTTIQVSETSSDAMHVQPGTACYGCHSTLDPMRDFFRQSYSVAYSTQLLDPVKSGIPAAGTFTVDGSAPVMGNGLGALASALAQHPRFAPAWVNKLCQFANSTGCSADDPEVARVAAAWKASNYNFKTLVRELFSSPLVTFAATTKTAVDQGMVIGIARRETTCAALAGRLGLPNLCTTLAGTAGVGGVQGAAFVAKARNLVLSVPGGGYTRGDTTPLLPHDPNMFFTSAMENLCFQIAVQLVDAGKTSRYLSASKDDAIKDFVATVMGLPASDPRSATMTSILQDHYGQAVKASQTPTNALRSTFTLACESPAAVSVGL